MDSSAASKRGDSLNAEGDKALNRTLIFGFGKAGKYEDAAEAFKNAGNAYKLASLWQSAGDAFLKSADAHLVLESSTDACSNVVEAAQCYKKINPLDSVNAYRRAIDMYNEGGRFGMSARYCKEMAEVYEADSNAQGALEAYQEAADLFVNDHKKSNANQCFLKVATLASDMGDLSRAAAIFEDIGKDSLTSRLGAYSAKGYFFQSLLCHLALGDNVAVTQKLDSCKNLDFSFNGSRECEFIDKLLQACEGMDLEAYSDACMDFDRVSPLDPWKTSLLLKAKAFIAEATGDEVDLS